MGGREGTGAAPGEGEPQAGGPQRPRGSALSARGPLGSRRAGPCPARSAPDAGLDTEALAPGELLAHCVLPCTWTHHSQGRKSEKGGVGGLGPTRGGLRPGPAPPLWAGPVLTRTQPGRWAGPLCCGRGFRPASPAPGGGLGQGTALNAPGGGQRRAWPSRRRHLHPTQRAPAPRPAPEPPPREWERSGPVLGRAGGLTLFFCLRGTFTLNGARG